MKAAIYHLAERDTWKAALELVKRYDDVEKIRCILADCVEMSDKDVTEDYHRLQDMIREQYETVNES